jgi:acyl-CoA thioesterase FadM
MRVAEVRDKSVRYGFLVRRKGDGEEIVEGHIIAVSVDKVQARKQVSLTLSLGNLNRFSDPDGPLGTPYEH